MKRTLLLLLFALFVSVQGFAQTATAVSQTASRLDGASMFSVTVPGTACVTVNSTVVLGTVTIPAVAGKSFYMTGFYLDIVSNATGTTAVSVYTSAGLSGLNPVWSTADLTIAAAPSSGFRQIAEVYSPPIQGLLNTAVTFTPSAQDANRIFCPRVTGYYAP